MKELKCIKTRWFDGEVGKLPEERYAIVVKGNTYQILQDEDNTEDVVTFTNQLGNMFTWYVAEYDFNEYLVLIDKPLTKEDLILGKSYRIDKPTPSGSGTKWVDGRMDYLDKAILVFGDDFVDNGSWLETTAGNWEIDIWWLTEVPSLLEDSTEDKEELKTKTLIEPILNKEDIIVGESYTICKPSDIVEESEWFDDMDYLDGKVILIKEGDLFSSMCWFADFEYIKYDGWLISLEWLEKVSEDTEDMITFKDGLSREQKSIVKAYYAGFKVDEDEGEADIDKSIKSDGGSSEYYKIVLPEWLLDKQKEQGYIMVEDLGELLFNNNFNYTNIFKAQKRMFELEQGCGKEGNSFDYDNTKCKYYLDKQLEVYKR